MRGSRLDSIAGIEVEGLFGLYDFRLGLSSGKAFDPQLLLLYGDNGTGKTTILRLIHHTISPEPSKGHRTALVNISVRRFSVTLASGAVVSLRRPEDGLTTGAYTWSLQRPDKPTISILVEPDATGSVRKSEDPTVAAQWSEFERSLSRLGVAVYFLPDDRKVGYDPAFSLNLTLLNERNHKKLRRSQSDSALEVAVLDLVNSLRSQFIEAGRTGEENINQIYRRLVRRLLRNRGSEDTRAEAVEAVHTLSSLAVRSEPFSALGLMPRLEFGDLLSEIQQAEPGVKALIENILKPYIDSISARLDALASVQTVIETFVKQLNEFFTGKLVSFDLQGGLSIKLPNDRELHLNHLSSGEKQLLLLFGNTIRARGQATIFIIDEPELSLNVKWQRKLLQALLQLVKGSSVQFVVATHSIELLAGQRESVVRLNSQSSNGLTDTWNEEPS